MKQCTYLPYLNANFQAEQAAKVGMRWYVQRVHINYQGYDRSGNYWGMGPPSLWYCYSADDKYAFYIRGTREYAREAYNFVRKSPDPAQVCFNIRMRGTWK